MNNLFKNERPQRAERVCRVENLNPNKGISQSYVISKDQRKHTVVLCLADKTVKTVFLSSFDAIEQLKKNRALYKAKK